MSEPAAESRYRPVDRTAWISWVVVCAAVPVLHSILGMALTREVSSTDPHARLLWYCLYALIIATPLAPPVLQWIVLRRIAPRLRLWAWLGAVIVAGIVLAAMHFYYHDISPGRLQRSVSLGLRLATEPPIAHVRGLWRFLVSTTAFTIAVALVPAWTLGIASSRKWHAFLLAAVVGAWSAAAVDLGYDVFIREGSIVLLRFRPESIQELLLQAGAGAVGGAVSACALAWMLGSAAPGAALPPARFPDRHWIIGLAILAAVVTPAVVVHLMEPFVVGYLRDQFLKAVSAAPIADRSEGERVLAYSHDAADRVTQYPVVSFAPDGKSFVVRAADEVLTRIDVESGRSLGRIGERRGRHESPSVQWSSDSRFLALRTDGEEVKIAGTIYSRRQSRLRLLTIPDYRVVGEFWSRNEACFQDFGSGGLMFERDGASLWLLCGPGVHYPKPGDILAIRLGMPALQLLAVRRYGNNAVDGRTRGFTRVRGRVWSWQLGYKKGARMRFHDLDSGQEVLVLPDLGTPDLAGGLSFQSMRMPVDEGQIVLVFCGLPTEVSNPVPPPAEVRNRHRYCRHLVIDTSTGALIGKREGYHLHRFQAYVGEEHGIHIDAILEPASTSGEIVVLDAATGRERQRIVTLAQRPLRVSPDGRWLVTHAVDRDVLRIYRLQP